MRHIVRQGECAASLAARHGMTPDSLMERDGNRALRDARPNPHVLAPGDIVDIPEPTERQLAFSSGGTARYRARVPRTHLILKLTLPNGEAAADKRFEVVAAGLKDPIEGTTTSSGVLDVEIGVTHTRATVRLFIGGDEPLEIPVLLGHLDPLDQPSGVRGRLQNLGYPVAEGPDGLAASVRAFQRREELPVTGTLDELTRTRLVERHGS